MLSQGWSKSNNHQGDVYIRNGDLEIEGNLIVDSALTITDISLSGELNTDLIQPYTASGNISIQNSASGNIARFDDDQKFRIHQEIKPLSSTLILSSLNDNTIVHLDDGSGVPTAGLRLVSGTKLNVDKIESQSYDTGDNPTIDFSASAVDVTGNFSVSNEITSDLTMNTTNTIIWPGLNGSGQDLLDSTNPDGTTDKRRIVLRHNRGTNSWQFRTYNDAGSLLANALNIVNNATSSAFIGINQTAPSYELDVTGDINITGNSFLPNIYGGESASDDLTLGSTTNATKGDIILSDDTECNENLKYNTSVYSFGLRPLGRMFSAVNSQGVSTAAAETTLFATSGAVGTLTIPANGMIVGDVYTARLTGHIASNGSQDLKITPKIAGSAWGGTKTLTLNEASRVMWKLEYTIVSKVLGVIPFGNIRCTCVFKLYDSSNQFLEFVVQDVVQVDTTTSTAIDVTAQWVTAHASNLMFTQSATIDIT